MINVKGLCKEYLIFSKPNDWLASLFKKDLPTIKALEQISFSVAAGEVLGIIGDNGAGKSTLLKVLTGVIDPTSGTVSVNGRLSAILEVSTGFNPLLTGRENIRQRLMLQGNSTAIVRKLEPAVIEFSELKDVIDQPVITYSTGMAARLAFAIVTEAVNDVLFIDELLVVGDEHFQGKCFKRIKEICASGKTVVIASHNISFVERLCHRAIWLEQGKIRMEGLSHNVGMAYYEKDKDAAAKLYPQEYGSIYQVIPKITGNRMVLEIDIVLSKKNNNLYLQVAVHDNRLGVLACLLNSAWENKFLPPKLGHHVIDVEFDLPEGLQKGLIGLVLKRGTGKSDSDIIEDNWGWDIGKQVYFSKDITQNVGGYIQRKLTWQYVS